MCQYIFILLIIKNKNKTIFLFQNIKKDVLFLIIPRCYLKIPIKNIRFNIKILKKTIF